MALGFLSRLIRRVIELARIHRMDDVAKDAEILVLRHQLTVLRRQVAETLAPGSVENVDRTTSAVFRSAVRDRVVQFNPFDGVTLPRGPRSRWCRRPSRRSASCSTRCLSVTASLAYWRPGQA